MEKIIKGNVQVLRRSMYWELTKEGLEEEECKAKYSLFMESQYQRLGSHTEVRDLVELCVENTLQHIPYEE